MGIVIGAATTVSFAGACATSVSWGANPNNQRLFCLGSWTPHIVISKPVETLNITIYAPGTSYGTKPSGGCANANTKSASVNPAGCGGGASGVSGSWYVTSYSYSKDSGELPGTESWSMQKWIGSLQPSYVLRGICDGQATSDAGVTFSSVDGDSSTGSVSAGGIGRADTLQVGIVSAVGGGSSSKGDTGQGSASIPYTDLYI